MKVSKNQLKLGIITIPVGKAGVEPLLNLTNILSRFSSDIYIISGNVFTAGCISNQKIHVISISYNYDSTVTKLFRHILLQLQISFALLNIARKVDLFIFFYGGPILVLPMLLSKILNKKIILLLAGSSSESSKASRSLFSKPLYVLERVNYLVAHKIVIYSKGLIEQWNLEEYRHKISIAHRHFLDFNRFKMQKQLNERGNLIGYIGRLSEEKGVMNFIKAISYVLKGGGAVKFLIGGDGPLRDEIEKYLSEENLNGKVGLPGWIPHDNLPKYLNDLKLLVLPSYTEGLPNIMLEAMACGTPVLATPVGAIPDFIKEGETGFIMENNSPECIARNITRALKHLALEEIAQNARALVEREFTYEKAVERYRSILASLE